MLPFLKPKAVSGIIISHRKSDGSDPKNEPEDQEDQGLMACAEQMIRAMHAKDAQGVAEAFKAAFEILESAPHEEAEHEHPDSGES